MTPEGLAHFALENRSDGAIADLTFEFTYRSETDAIIRVDTVTFESASNAPGESPAFLNAAGSTFLVQTPPEGGVSADASVLELTYVDGTVWSESE